MDIRQRALVGCAVAVTMLLFACEMPRAVGVASAVPEAYGVLDPGKAAPDLEENGIYVLWQHDLGQIDSGEEIREIYLAGDTLLVEAGGTLFHFDATKGYCTAATSLANVVSEPPVIVNERLYLLSGRWVLDIDPDSGEIQRRIAPRLAVTSPPAPYPASLLLGGCTGRLVRLGVETGAHVWLTSAEGAVMTPPVFDGVNVYVVGHNGKVVAVSGDEGEELWRWGPKPPSKLTSGLTLADGRLYVGDNRGYLYCHTVEGVPMWRYPTGGPISVAPEPVRGKLLVFPHKSEALCLDPEEPTVLWEHPDAERLLATGEKGVYLLTRDNSVAYVLLETGEEKWRRSLVEDCAVTSDPSQPTFYLYTRSGAIMAIRELP